jgi:hypothetical protein
MYDPQPTVWRLPFHAEPEDRSMMTDPLHAIRAALADATARAKANPGLNDGGRRTAVTKDVKKPMKALSDHVNTLGEKLQDTRQRAAARRAEVLATQPAVDPWIAEAVVRGAAAHPEFRAHLSALVLSGPTTDDERKMVQVVAGLPSTLLLGLPASDLTTARAHVTRAADADPAVIALEEQVAECHAELRGASHALGAIHLQLDPLEIAGQAPPRPSLLPLAMQEKMDPNVWALAEANAGGTGPMIWADPMRRGFVDVVNALAGADVLNTTLPPLVADAADDADQAA